MKVTGTISRINFYNKKNGYTVALFDLEAEEYSIAKRKSHLIGNRLTVVGIFDRLALPEEEYTLNGEFVKDPTYGLQFHFDTFERKNLYTESSVINYLSSEIFPEIGEKTAKIIVKKLGVDAIDKIAKDRTILDGLGINSKKADTIYSIVIENRANEETILFFIQYGISMDTCHKIVARLGINAVEMVKESPYILMEKIDHFGFLKNDAFALKMGIAKDSDVRLKAVIKYTLKQYIYSSGNSHIDRHSLMQLLTKYLRDIEAIPYERFEEILKILIKDKQLYMNNDGWLFDYELYEKENKLAQVIVNKLQSIGSSVRSFTPNDIEEAYQAVSLENDITLSDMQKTAVKSAFLEPIMIITGGPGTGKTTIVKTILRMFVKLMNDNSTVLERVALLAPTGRAAKRLKETSNIDAQTIHKYLGYAGEGYFAKNADNPTEEELIIVDEASMMDLPLAYQLLTTINKNARVIIVGDVDQLPSVGPGQILKDLIDCKEISTIRLKKIHRQAENSQIIRLAHDINDGIISENIMTKFTDRSFIPTDNEHLMEMLIDLVALAISKGKDIKKDIQILVPMYRCQLGINEINTRLQEVINPLNNRPELKRTGEQYRENDKVIQLVNRSEKNIMNGDIGVVDHFIYADGEIRGLSVAYDTGMVDYTIDELDDIKLAYAISVHKAQGSEFDMVIMPVSSNYSYMLKRKLIYTSVTRAKNLLILMGDIRILQLGIKKIEQNRSTILLTKIKSLLNSDVAIIDDASSAFSTIGEHEYGEISPYDFEKIASDTNKKVSKNNVDLNSILGEHEFEDF